MKIFSILFCLTIISGCGGKEDPVVTDPEVAILGKWEVIENSLGPVATASQYEEYKADSVLDIYRYAGGELVHYKYWFSDSMLYKGGVFVDSYNDTIVIKEPYTFKFLSPDKLRMDFQYPALVNWYIYQRKK